MNNKKVYVVAEELDGEISNAGREVWTLSIKPDCLGWETDCGYPGYGLSKEVAEAYATAINENELLWKVVSAAQELLNRAERMIGYKTKPGDPPALMDLRDLAVALSSLNAKEPK